MLASDWLIDGRFANQGSDIDESAVATAQRRGVKAEVHNFP